MARGCGVEHELRVDHILVAVRTQREDAHADAKFEIDHKARTANADD